MHFNSIATTSTLLTATVRMYAAMPLSEQPDQPGMVTPKFDVMPVSQPANPSKTAGHISPQQGCVPFKWMPITGPWGKEAEPTHEKGVPPCPKPGPSKEEQELVKQRSDQKKWEFLKRLRKDDVKANSDPPPLPPPQQSGEHGKLPPPPVETPDLK